MNGQSDNAHDRGVEELQQRVEDLRQKVEAREAIERARLAKPEAQGTGQPPPEAGEQDNLKKLVADKSYDARTQARSILEQQPPATTEAGMDERAEAGPESKDREFWPGRRGPEG